MRRLAVSLVAVMVWLVSAASPSVARAETDPDTEIAHGHFLRGSEFYKEGRYDEAAVEFEAARKAKQLPDFDYNIGRCYEQLGKLDLAIAAYDRFVAATMGPQAVEVRAHVQELRARRAAEPQPPKPPETPPETEAPPAHPVTTTTAPPPSGGAPAGAAPIETLPPSRRSNHLLPIVVGGVAVAALAAGAILVGTVSSDYGKLETSCSPHCDKSRWSGLQTRAYAGDALLVAGGVAAAADVLLWILDLRHGSAPPTERRAFLLPAGAGIIAGARF